MMHLSSLGLVPLAFALPSVCSLACSEEAITSILETIPDASLNYVHWVSQGESFGDAPIGIGVANASSLPELCGLSVNIKTPDNTSYNFGVFLPKHWNQRIMTIGNGGYSGGVNWGEMGRYTHYGFASVSTDTGHISRPDDCSWGLNQPEKIINWGHRAMHGSVAAAKRIVEAYYKNSISFSYYSSCSNGGRQGLKEIQLYPETFDGIVIGAPGWHPTHLSGWITRQAIINSGTGSARVENELLDAAVAEMITQCDPQDGVTDGIISDPFGCNFDFNQLLCGTGNHSPCLTADQIRTVELLYGDYWGTNQSLVFSRLSLGADASVLSREPTGLGTSPFRYLVHNDSNWDYNSLSYEDILKADEINPGQSRADNFNLEPFHKRGGKLIMYHGLDDMLIPASGSINLYNSIYRTLMARNIDISDFLRFYLVPGMGHCFGGPVAPWYFAAGFQDLKGATHSVPGFENSKHDITLQIMDWVEKGIEPMGIVATKFKQDTVGKVEKQRPVCIYPAQARYTGGDVDAARNWKCEYSIPVKDITLMLKELQQGWSLLTEHTSTYYAQIFKMHPTPGILSPVIGTFKGLLGGPIPKSLLSASAWSWLATLSASLPTLVAMSNPSISSTRGRGEYAVTVRVATGG